MPFLEAALKSSGACSLTVGGESGSQQVRTTLCSSLERWTEHTQGPGTPLDQSTWYANIAKSTAMILRAHGELCWGESHHCGNKEYRKPQESSTCLLSFLSSPWQVLILPVPDILH